MSLKFILSTPRNNNNIPHTSRLTRQHLTPHCCLSNVASKVNINTFCLPASARVWELAVKLTRIWQRPTGISSWRLIHFWVRLDLKFKCFSSVAAVAAAAWRCPAPSQLCYFNELTLLQHTEPWPPGLFSCQWEYFSLIGTILNLAQH